MSCHVSGVPRQRAQSGLPPGKGYGGVGLPELPRRGTRQPQNNIHPREVDTSGGVVGLQRAKGRLQVLIGALCLAVSLGMETKNAVRYKHAISLHSLFPGELTDEVSGRMGSGAGFWSLEV